MVRSIIIVAALLAGLAYAAFFLMWNAETRAHLIVTPKLGGHPYWIESVPVALLPIIGAVIGAVIMAIAAWLPWAGQRAAAKALEAKLQKAIDKFNEQKGILRARNERIADLEEELDELESRAQPAAAELHEAPVEAPDESAPEADEDDESVI